VQHSDSSYNERSSSSRHFVLVLSGIVILILMGLLSSKLSHEIDNLERTQFELRLAELKAAVVLIQASLVANGKMDSALEFEGANPMDWLEGDTTQYLGEMPLEEAEKYAGNWVFDPVQKVIAYLPKSFEEKDLRGFKRSLESHNDSIKKSTKRHVKWLRFRVVALRSKDNKRPNDGYAYEEYNYDKDSSRDQQNVKGLELKAL